MKIVFLVAGVLAGCLCKAQKNYEYTDTRKKNESFAKIAQKDIRADLSVFTLSGISESIGREGLQKIPFTSFGPDSMLFAAGDIEATVITAGFDPAKH